VHLAAVVALALAATPATPAPAPPTGEDAAVLRSRFAFGAGYAYFSQQTEHGRVNAGGLALAGRYDTGIAPNVDFGLTLTWGLTDWDRAREYIDAGNRAGKWTTDSLARVEAWVSNAPEKEKAARLFGAIFADFFLILSYVAVPACYVGSAGGATSHLQLDATITYRLGDGPSFAFVEGGIGAAALPYQVVDWRGALGPVGGIGMQLGGIVRIGARALWSPPGLNRAPFGGPTTMGAILLSSPR
jgi:hypothetical protein